MYPFNDQLYYNIFIFSYLPGNRITLIKICSLIRGKIRSIMSINNVTSSIACSHSMQNITVVALKKDKVVEKHTCIFDNPASLNHYPTYNDNGNKIYQSDMDQIQCATNVTKLQFKR